MFDIEKLSREELIELVLDQRKEQSDGIRMTYPGQTPPWQIIRRVQPRGQRIEAKLCCGEPLSKRNSISCFKRRVVDDKQESGRVESVRR